MKTRRLVALSLLAVAAPASLTLFEEAARFTGAARLAAAQPADDKPLVDKVKRAIDDGVRFLREQEGGKGHFEHTAFIAKNRPGGVTALCTVALLQSGVATDDPIIQRCLKYLRTMPPEQTYTVGLQTMAFCLAGEEQDRQRVQRNLDWLKKYQVPGGWGYTAGLRSPDHSINQYALLGVHEAMLAGFEPDKDMLRSMYELYKGNKRGQWTYRSRNTPTLTMTTAGLCNLLITRQDLRAKARLNADGSDDNCGKREEEETVRNALRYIAAEYPNDISQDPSFVHPYYCLYGIERAGRLTGRRFFGEHDWYRIGCEYLVAAQRRDGSWKGSVFDQWPTVATPLALLFLSKGRTPVLISKFAHGATNAPIQEWNRKPHDLRHVVEFASRELFERQPLAWQAFDSREVPLPLGNRPGKSAKDLAEELLQTPIVYLTGHNLDQNLIGKREEEVLKEYLENGGFIFAEACCNSPRFDRQFRQLMKNVTGSNLAPLKKNHPVWNASGKFEVPPGSFGLEGIQQGCKTVVIYSPRAISGWWDNNDHKSAKGQLAFHTAANVIAYATGMVLPKPRLTEVQIVRDSDIKPPPQGYFQVVQLVLEKDAQPLAPKAMPHLMAELRKQKLDVHHKTRKLTLTEEALLQSKFFYMHDRNSFAVPDAKALKNLKFTLETGGLLFADAACGSKAFDKSFRELVKTMFGTDLEPIDLRENQAKNELYSKEVNGFVIESVKYRREERVTVDDKEVLRPSKDFQEGPPRLEGIKLHGRWVVIYSRYDIGCALEKHQSTDCLGHDYESAKKLARAVVLYALRR